MMRDFLLVLPLAAISAASDDSSTTTAGFVTSTPGYGGSGNATRSSAGSATNTSSSSGFTATIGISLEDYWNEYVGPVEVAAINTTVSATPVPSSELVPPPTLSYAAFPTGQQVPAIDNPALSKNDSWKFPSDFWWGVASAAYQVEGAVKDEGRGPSIWDVLTHRVTDYTVANQTGDVADNQYYLYKQDIERIAALGVPWYSFSISWSRIFPFGSGQVNEEGLKHYDDLIDSCIAAGVQPAVTMYHWDLPLALQNSYGGWLSEKIVDDFTAYAEVLYKRWGNKVQKWFTVNEPIVYCSTYPLPEGYFAATDIPAKQQQYWCGHHTLLAHASAYRLGKRLGINGTISFKTNGGYKIPLTNSSDDALAVQRAWDFNEGWFANPTFLDGDYPKYLKQYVSTFLPNFTAEQKEMINGSSDVFAHDAYTSQFYYAPDGGVAACVSNSSNPLYPGCFNTSYTYASDDGGWNIGYAADPGSPWLHKATDWVPQFLRYMQDTWKPRGGVAVTEFGFSVPFEGQKTVLGDIRFDYPRAQYYREYMQAILMAISEGVNVVGCLAWSLVDNLEWSEGYTVRFGMQYVNFTTQERYYKASFFWYVDAFKQYGGQENNSSTSSAL